jgi:ribosomal protein L37AE/L43A
MFYCDTCDIKTNNKFDYNRHLLSAKHQRLCSNNAKCTTYIHGLISEGGGGGTVAESIPQKPPLNILSNPQNPTIVQINLNEEDDQQNVIYNEAIKNDSDDDSGGEDGSEDSGDDDGEDGVGDDDSGHVTSAASAAYECKYCKRPYINRTGLWRHNKKFGALCITKVVNASKMKNTAELKNIITTMMKMNNEFKTQILDLYKTSMTAITATTVAANSTVAPTSITNNNSNTNNMTNCGNQTFNMQFFLNEKCKDAMNMKDFVNSIQLNTDDLENVGKLGYVEGMSNILITNLNKTELHKRPVHCSDIKRETLYVKDADKWECDGPDHAKMTNAVLAVEHKNVSLMGEWAALHPKCMNSNTNDNNRYFKLSKIVTDGAKDGNISKVIRRVAKNVLIDKTGPFVG